ncbi:MAG: DUF4352 domain-containing protein [Eubacterium sp.]|nr:DUF4352 domain-containing protein [Eubacterium sp.]
MKGSRMRIAAVLFVAAVTLSGCGEALYELTPEEQAAIVSYASHTVAKFNNYQKDGEIFVRKDILEGDEASQEVKTPDLQQAEPEESIPADDTEMPVQDMAASQDDGNAQGAEPEGSFATIGQALDLGVIQADYTGSSLCTTYQKSDSYAVDASPGSQFLVLNVKLTNQSAQDLYIDILAMTPTFQVTVNGESTAAAQTTILPNDLSTYQGNILAGASSDTVLVFEVSQEIENVSDIQLRITMNGSQNTINL